MRKVGSLLCKEHWKLLKNKNVEVLSSQPLFNVCDFCDNIGFRWLIEKITNKDFIGG